MNKPEHSPLPWFYDVKRGMMFDDDENDIAIVGNSANARFIIQCIETSCAHQSAIKELVKALEVFAIAADGFDDMPNRNPDEVFAYGGISYFDGVVGAITLSDLRKARAILAKHKPKAGE